MKTKNILIVGGSGILGSNLVNYIDPKANIYILDKKKFKGKQKNIKFLKFNFLKKKKLNQIPKKIDTVFFFAGIVGGSKSININCFQKYFKFNCQTLINFLEVSTNHNIKKIIYTSTEHVYGDNENYKLKNNLIEPYPKNYYGVTKLLSEKLLFEHYKRNKISIDILRFPRVIHQSQNSFINSLINKAIIDNQVLVDCPNLDFNLLYLDDLMNALKKCMSRNKKKIQVFNIFNDSRPISILKIIRMIKNFFNIDVEIKKSKFKLYKNHNPINLSVNNKFSKKELNWKPEFSNSSIIKQILNIYEVDQNNK